MNMPSLKTKLILSSLLAVAALAGGLWWGKHLTRSEASGVVSPKSAGSVKPKAPALTATENASKRRQTPPAGGSGLAARSSLAGLEAMIRDLSDANWRGDEGQEVRRMLAAVAPADIPKVLAFIEQNPARTARQVLRQDLLSHWAKTNPQAAAAWASTLPNGDNKQGAIHSVAVEWAQADLARALAWAQQLPEGRAKQDAFRSVGLGWARTDPQAALAWAKQLPEGNVKEGALGGI
jgi:hypothetical protein